MLCIAVGSWRVGLSGAGSFRTCRRKSAYEQVYPFKSNQATAMPNVRAPSAQSEKSAAFRQRILLDNGRVSADNQRLRLRFEQVAADFPECFREVFGTIFGSQSSTFAASLSQPRIVLRRRFAKRHIQGIGVASFEDDRVPRCRQIVCISNRVRKEQRAAGARRLVNH